MVHTAGPRLSPADAEQLPGRLRGRTDQVSLAFGHHPRLLESWYAWYGPLVRDMALPARLKEIVRLRVAQLNACEF